MLHFKLIPPSPASYLPRNRTVLPPYLYREAKYGADTDQVRFRHGAGTYCRFVFALVSFSGMAYK